MGNVGRVMGSAGDIREQTALDVVHFLEKELIDQVRAIVTESD